MSEFETELEMVRRHVREGTAHVTRQRQIVADFQEHGFPTRLARALLSDFEATLDEHQRHLVRLEEEGEGEPDRR